MVSDSIKTKIINLVIDNLEGGYYHPDMKDKLRNGERMLDSGETMFGIDRKNGAPQFTTKTPEAVKFWQMVDAYFGAHHGDTSYYGDKADGNKKTPAAVGRQLRNFVKEMILDAYDDYNDYLSDGAKKIVESDPKLFMQFLYAVWNGPGNFQRFANLVNAAYSNGERAAQAFFDIVQTARRNKGGLFAEGADKLDALATQLPSGGGFGWLLWLGLGIFAVTMITSKSKKK
jgi:hypothetical protein